MVKRYCCNFCFLGVIHSEDMGVEIAHACAKEIDLNKNEKHSGFIHASSCVMLSY